MIVQFFQVKYFTEVSFGGRFFGRGVSFMEVLAITYQPYKGPKTTINVSLIIKHPFFNQQLLKQLLRQLLKWSEKHEDLRFVDRSVENIEYYQYYRGSAGGGGVHHLC